MSSAEEALYKTLTEEIDVEFCGKPAKLVPISYKDDLMVSAHAMSFKEDPDFAALTKEAKQLIIGLNNVFSTVRYALRNPDKSYWFKSMAEVTLASADAVTLKEMERVFQLYYQELELTREEKKSS